MPVVCLFVVAKTFIFISNNCRENELNLLMVARYNSKSKNNNNNSKNSTFGIFQFAQQTAEYRKLIACENKSKQHPPTNAKKSCCILHVSSIDRKMSLFKFSRLKMSKHYFIKKKTFWDQYQSIEIVQCPLQLINKPCN